MLEDKTCELLRGGKNLLAFSYGSDSTALFYLLAQKNIPFDLALVNYKRRPNSDLEELEARNLARRWGKKIFTHKAELEGGNFESRARQVRYAFFEKICLEEGYENVLLAHQLDDRLEWFLMQLSRGAGLLELMGFEAVQRRENYTIIRPLLHAHKGEILDFLRRREIFYFEDESNANERLERNFMRQHFAREFMRHFASGVRRSFDYLQNDLEGLDYGQIVEFQGILICKRNESLIARALKMKGLRVSGPQRAEAFRADCVLAGRLGVVHWAGRSLVFSFVPCVRMPKAFREACRRAKIPRLLRGFLHHHQISALMMQNFLDKITHP